MKLRFHSTTVALLVAIGLGGCSMFGGKPEAPAKARESLEVPPDLARPQGAETSTGAPGGPAVYSTYTSKPAELTKTNGPEVATATAKAGVRLERDGALRWLVVESPPAVAMDRVRGFLQRRELALEVDNPKSGIFETTWIESKVNLGTTGLTKFFSRMHSTGLRDKYRFRIEAGRTPGTSEIYVSHLGLEERALRDDGRGAETGWQPRPTDLQAEAKMLADVMAAFGADRKQAETLVAEGAAQRVRKEEGGLLLPQEDFDRAWRRVGQALDRSSFVIEDRDRSQGAYYVHDRVAAAAAKKGGSLFGGWLRFGEDQEVIEERFQVVVKSTNGDSRVNVLDVKGKKTDASNAQRLLDYLQQQLQ
jgi:outer membrane protein assembly factor BamC